MSNDEKRPASEDTSAAAQEPTPAVPKTQPSQAGVPYGYAIENGKGGSVEVWKNGHFICSFPSLGEAQSFAKADREAAQESDQHANQEGAEDNSEANQDETSSVESDLHQLEPEGDEPDESDQGKPNEAQPQSSEIGVAGTRRRPRAPGR